MKVNFDRLQQEFLDTGMHPTRARELTKQIRQDMHDMPELYEDEKTWRWAFENGFVPGRLLLFGDAFNKDTYQDYYPDFEYFMAHPMNNHFIFWINDKLTLKYMLNTPGLSDLMPEYYLYIENDGHYSYLMDAPDWMPRDENFLYNILVEKKHLAMKPNRGSGGKGFFGLRYEDGTIYLNEKPITRQELEDLKADLNGYIVTQFIEQTDEMEDVFPGTDCALRIILYKKVQENPTAMPEYGCLLAYARFGSSRSNSASNLCHGGLAVRVNWDTGCFEGGFRGNTEFWGLEGAHGFDVHPDTHANVDGKPIPHWDVIQEGCLKVCNYLSSLDYFGLDVIVTDDGFKLCEINSAPSTGLGQFHSGKCCLDNEDARKYAASKRRPWKKDFIDCFTSAIEEY